MNAEESAICSRVQQARELERWTQKLFAAKLGVTLPKLVSIEYGWTPLRYSLARTMAETFNLNLRWLATGLPPRSPGIPIPEELAAKADEDGLLSTVYHAVLKPHFDGSSQFLKALESLRGKLDMLIAGAEPEPGAITAAVPRPEWTPAIERELAILRRYVAGVNRMIEQREFALETSREIYGALKESTAAADVADFKLIVDNNQLSADKPGVRHTWQNLKMRLAKATAVHGKKAEVAKFVGVDRSNLNRWLDDDQEPGAEATFRLLEWVTAEEAKSKSPGGAQTPPEPKAPSKDEQDESPKSGPRKRSHKGK